VLKDEFGSCRAWKTGKWWWIGSRGRVLQPQQPAEHGQAGLPRGAEPNDQAAVGKAIPEK
jgi:hypothetical protein